MDTFLSGISIKIVQLVVQWLIEALLNEFATKSII